MNNNIPEPSINQGPTMQPQNNLNITQSINPQQNTLNNLNNEQPVKQQPMPPMPPKKSKGPLVIIILLILIILGLAGYICYDKFVVTNNKCNVEKTTETDNKKILLKDKTKDIVYTYFTDKLTKDGEGEYEYNIPHMNIDSEDAISINNIISAKYKDRYEKNKKLFEESVQQKVGFYGSYINYKYYVNDNILSLFVYEGCETSEVCTSYDSYNIDVITGKKISNSELLKIKKVNDFAKTIKTSFEKLEKEEEWKKEGIVDNYYKQINEFNSKSPDEYYMYLNKNNELCIIFIHHGIPANHTVIINLDTDKYEYINKK